MASKRLAKETLIYGIGQVFNRFLAVLLLPLFTHLLTPTDYGVFGVLSLLGFFGVPILTLGLGVSLASSYCEKRQEAHHKERVIWTSVLIITIAALVFALFALLFQKQISVILLGTEKYSKLLFYTIMTTVLNSVCVPFTQYLQLERRVRTFVAINVFSTLAGLSTSVFLIVFLGYEVEGLVISGFVASTATLVLSFGVYFLGHPPHFSRALVRELLSDGLPMIPSYAFAFLIQHNSRYILQNFHSLEDVGLFSMGYNMGVLLSMLVAGFTSSWYAHFMSMMSATNEERNSLGRQLVHYIFSFGVLTLLLFIGARFAFLLLTRPIFYPGYTCVGFVAFGFFAQGLANMFLPGFYYGRRLRLVVVAQCATALCSVILSYALIPAGGIVGAALSFALAFSLQCTIQAFILKVSHLYIIPFSWREILPFAAIFVCTAVASLTPREWNLLQEGGYVLFLIILSGLFTIWKLPQEEFLQLQEFLKRWKRKPSAPKEAVLHRGL